MTGIAVIEQNDSISFKGLAIESKTIGKPSLNSVSEPFHLDSKKIKQIQERLKNLGLYNGKISGRLNQKLLKSTRIYHENEGLEFGGNITKDIFENICGTSRSDELNTLIGHEVSLQDTLNYYNSLPFFTQIINPIHVSQQPKTKEKLYGFDAKDDSLFIGIFLILVALSLIATFFIS
jgi:hypothetical protein